MTVSSEPNRATSQAITTRSWVGSRIRFWAASTAASEQTVSSAFDGKSPRTRTWKTAESSP
jgi:hypothetical protein